MTRTNCDGITLTVEISELAKALNLPAESIEEHIKVLDVAKDEDGKLYSVTVKPAELKLEAKLASMKAKISELRARQKITC